MRTSARISGAVAAAAAIGLLVGGCGSGDGDSGEGGKGGASDTAENKPPLGEEGGDEGSGDAEGNGAGGSGGSVDPAALTGSWTTHPMVEGDSVVFDVTEDKRVSMIMPARCKGTLSGRTLDLSCTEGKKGYTHGVVKSASGKNMTVSWSNGRTVKMQRMKSNLPDAPEPPSDFPSAEDPF
ncbi:hypothetical protein ABZY93_20695 [Streptomyces smyrnaeus]|uniref:hypothetical protein n=1 Tax=Streptomyces smyrnaeus TaxID=1387713 RepID=UPI0033BE35F2